MRQIIKNKISKIGTQKIQFIKHSKNYLLGDLATQALSFISIPILTRLLAPEEYGVLSVINSITQIFSIIMILNFHGSLSRNYYEKENNFKSFLGTIILFLLIYNFLFVNIMYFAKDFFANFFNIEPKIFCIAIMNSFFYVFITLYLSYLQASQRSKKFALLSFFKSISILILSIIWIVNLNKNNYLGRIYSELVLNLVFAIYSSYMLYKICEFKFEIKSLKYALSFGIPLIPHAMSGFILAQFDRIAINQIAGAEKAGLYSFAYNVGMIMNIIVMAGNKSWIPIFYKSMEKNDKSNIQKLVEIYTKIILFFALGLILFSKELVMILADKKYFVALDLVPVIVIGYVFVYLYTLYANYAFYRKKTYLISISTIGAGVINIVLNYIFIPKYGYVAGAYTTLISYILLFISHYINSKYILKEDVVKLVGLLRYFVILILILILFFYIKIFIKNFIIMIIIKIMLLFSYLVLVLRRDNIVAKFRNEEKM